MVDRVGSQVLIHFNSFKNSLSLGMTIWGELHKPASRPTKKSV